MEYLTKIAFPKSFRENYHTTILSNLNVGDFFRFTNGSLTYLLVDVNWRSGNVKYIDSNGRSFENSRGNYNVHYRWPKDDLSGFHKHIVSQIKRLR